MGLIMSRTFNTPIRDQWNAPIHNILKAIDNHNSEYFRTGDTWHLEQANILRAYVTNLKDWIKNNEHSRLVG